MSVRSSDTEIIKNSHLKIRHWMLSNLFWILFLRMSVWRPLVVTSEMCRPLSELRVLSNRLHSLLWFFNLNCLLHSPLKLWRRQKCIAPHLSFSLVWNLYLIVFYFQIIHLKKEAMQYWLLWKQWRQRVWGHKASLWQRSQDIPWGSFIGYSSRLFRWSTNIHSSHPS